MQGRPLVGRQPWRPNGFHGILPGKRALSKTYACTDIDWCELSIRMRDATAVCSTATLPRVGYVAATWYGCGLFGRCIGYVADSWDGCGAPASMSGTELLARGRPPQLVRGMELCRAAPDMRLLSHQSSPCSRSGGAPARRGSASLSSLRCVCLRCESPGTAE